jgi:folate-binding Fe-S cluster repair protein YgfZ
VAVLPDDGALLFRRRNRRALRLDGVDQVRVLLLLVTQKVDQVAVVELDKKICGSVLVAHKTKICTIAD